MAVCHVKCVTCSNQIFLKKMKDKGNISYRQSVTNTFFDRIRIPNIIWFLEITEYQILNTIWYWENSIPNAKYYLVSRKSEYRIWIVLFGPTIQISNTKYRIVFNILEKIKKKKYIYLSHTRHLFCKFVKLFGQVFGPTIPIPEYYLGWKKTRIPNTEYYSVLRKSEYRIRILLFCPIIRIVFEYRIICYTLYCSYRS